MIALIPHKKSRIQYYLDKVTDPEEDPDLTPHRSHGGADRRSGLRALRAHGEEIGLVEAGGAQSKIRYLYMQIDYKMACG
jgi:hypothetical protein